ncbi:hypothetical protein BDZ91DRAFT_514668 [Kalaharituber pfeilii]|nr:hypothetical protein BDZ91DRAFT_514668 [Kalaharituber pfeilii]
MAEPPLPLFPSSMPPHGFFPQHAQRNSGLVAQPLAPPAATSYPNMIPASSSQPLQPFYPPQPQYPYIPPNTKQPAFIGPTLPIPPQQQFHPGAMRPNPAAPLFHPLQSYSNSNIHPNYAMPPAAQSASPSGAPQPWQVDVYAPSFVPSYFMQINTLPAISVRSPPPWSISYPSYISSFAGTSLLQPLPPYPSIQSPTTRALSLSPSTYLPYFFDLFVKELSAQHQNARLYDMYNVPLYPHDLANFQFKLMVPGIREDCPSVQIGDMVHLRQIRSNGFNMYPPAGFTGYQYEAYIHGIDRQAGFLVLRIDDLRLESGMFNVCFLVQERIFGPHSRAVHECSKLLASGEKVGDGSFPNIRQLSVGHVDNGSIANAGIERSTYLRKMLFPEKEDGVLQTTLSKGMFKHRWFDIELNYEQQKAVDAILEQNYGTVPYLISGPPGTGKTKTIVEAALQLIFAPATQRSHILLCAPSNQAADTLAQRLIKHLSPKVLFRMNNCSRSFAESCSHNLCRLFYACPG